MQVVSSSACDPLRPGIEGFFILHNVPDYRLTVELPHRSLSENAPTKLRSSRTEILKRFSQTSEEDRMVRETWVKWFEIYLPLSVDGSAYAAQLRRHGVKYEVPLRHLLFSPRSKLLRDLRPFDELDRLNSESIEWPRVECFAMPSVTSSFNDNPPAPRLFRQTDQAWVDSMASFNDATKDYYAATFPATQTMDNLKHLLRNTLSYACSIPSTSGIYYFV